MHPPSLNTSLNPSLCWVSGRKKSVLSVSSLPHINEQGATATTEVAQKTVAGYDSHIRYAVLTFYTSDVLSSVLSVLSVWRLIPTPPKKGLDAYCLRMTMHL